MPKRKCIEIHGGRDREIYNKDEIMTETVHLCIQYNLLKGLESNDMHAIEFAQKLNLEQLIEFNKKIKVILSQ